MHNFTVDREGTGTLPEASKVMEWLRIVTTENDFEVHGGKKRENYAEFIPSADQCKMCTEQATEKFQGNAFCDVHFRKMSAREAMMRERERTK